MDRPRVSARRALERLAASHGEEPDRFDFVEDQRLLRQAVPDKASSYIRGIGHLKAGDKVVLCCRVSGREQRRRRNLKDQEAELRQVAAERGATVVDVVTHVGPGWDPSWLAPAVETAKKCGAKLLARSTNRFIRHPDYHSINNPDAQARDVDLEAMWRVADGEPLVTVVPPDAPPGDERSKETTWGQQQKGHKGGRPTKTKPAGYKKERREQQLNRVLKLHRRGLPLGDIVVLIGTPKSTTARWIAKYA